jgi:hypothetical protein
MLTRLTHARQTGPHNRSEQRDYWAGNYVGWQLMWHLFSNYAADSALTKHKANQAN